MAQLLKEKNYIEVSSIEELTPQALLRVVQAHKTYQRPRLQKLMKYYQGKNPTILSKQKVTDKPDSRITNAFGRVIVDEITNVFISEPIKYTSDDTTALLELNVINEMNNEAYHSYNLAKHASIYGIGCELLYTDANAEIRFALVNPETVIPVYSTGINVEQIGAIRYYSVESLDDIYDDKDYIEVYSKDSILYYQNFDSSLKLLEVVPHYFGACPLNVYNSSEQEISDLEPVTSLIDSYDELLSSVDNMYRYFSDAYLVLTGVDEITAEEVLAMKQNRVILMPEGSNAQFLAKQTDSASLKDQFDRLKDNIWKFSYCVPLDEQTFGNDVSGVALRYRMMMLEGVCSARERLFTAAIKKRIEMCFNILGVKGKHYSAEDIDLRFTRNIPANESEAIANATALTGIVSKETIFEMLPSIDPMVEMQRLEEEQNGLNAMLDPYSGMALHDDDDENELPVME